MELCDNCKEQVPPVWDDIPHQVDGGLIFDLSGHYGGFVDLIGVEGSVILCKQCCLIMWEALPGLAEQERFKYHA